MTPSIFPKRKGPFLLKRQLIGCSSSVVPWFHCPGDFVWVFGMTSFLSKRDSVLCIHVRHWLKKHLNLKCYTCYQRSITIEKIGFPSVWSCLPSERCSGSGGHGTDIMPMEPYAQTTSLWEKRCVLGHMWDILTLKIVSSMMDTMSSCTGGMSKLMERRIHQMFVPLGWTILSPSLESWPQLSLGSQAKSSVL